MKKQEEISSRIMAIKFTIKLLREEGIPKKVFVEMINALPDDAKIVGFFEYRQENSVSIVVQSESYKEIPGGVGLIPSLRAVFTSEGEQVKVEVIKWIPKFIKFE